MINGSFVFGLDSDDRDVFKRTVEWGIENAITTSTFHILTPYPGTQLYNDMQNAGRITTTNWDLYDTRHVVYKTKNISAEELEKGYHWAYREFYAWSNIAKASLQHDAIKHMLKHFLYAGGWKKFEPLWNLVIETKNLALMLPFLESILSKVSYDRTDKHKRTESTPCSSEEHRRPVPDPLKRMQLSNPTEHNP